MLVASLYFAREVLIPLALAVLLSFLLAPLVSRLERWKIPRVPAVLLVAAFTIAVLGGIGYVVAGQLRDLALELNRGEYQQKLHKRIQWLKNPMGGTLGDVAKPFRKLGEEFASPSTLPATTQSATTQPATLPTPAQVRPGRDGLVPDPVVPGEDRGIEKLAHPEIPPAEAVPVKIVPPLPTVGEYIENAVIPLLGPLGTTFIVVVFTIFVLIQREDLRDRIIRLVGQGQMTVTTQAMNEAADRISRYLLMQSLINGSVGVAVGIGLKLLGVPNPALWGLLAALLRFVPYIGIWVAASLPLILSFAVFESSRQTLELIGLFVAIEVITANALEPWLYGSSTGISTLAVLVSAAFWTWLWGPIGLLLATPLTVVLVVLGRYVPQLQFLSVLLGDEPVLEPSERYYQRLLAGDPEESLDVLDEFLPTQPLQKVYDTIVIPALARAEADFHYGRLDEARHRFVRQSIREVVEDMEDNAPPAPAPPSPPAPDQKPRGNGNTEIKADQQPRMSVPKSSRISILCLPARDEADEIIAMMLAQLLRKQGALGEAVSVTALASEMGEKVAERKAELVCVSALPPSAIGHARYLCKRLHARFADLEMVVGLWTSRADLKKAKVRMGCGESIRIVNTLDGALAELQQLLQPILLRESNAQSAAESAASQP